MVAAITTTCSLGLKPSIAERSGLVEGLLPLVLAAADARPPLSADRVELVDEYYIGRYLLCVLEHAAYTGSADAH